MVLRKLLAGSWPTRADELADPALRGMKPRPRARTLQLIEEGRRWLVEAQCEPRRRIRLATPAVEPADVDLAIDAGGDAGGNVAGTFACFGDDY